ncbi:hypothetical protein [Nonomuraea sp. NPDC049709]|uniref:hypothetical protein n=1 Tax=Nonomuraea sp. NPDC049709 TaxID=3154736 RepID=UPI00344979A3
MFAAPSVRWTDPRAQLLNGAGWQTVRAETLAGLGLAAPGAAHLTELAGALDAAWRLLAQRLEQAGPEVSVRLVPAEDGRVKLAVDRLEAIGESESLKTLRAETHPVHQRVLVRGISVKWAQDVHEFRQRQDPVPLRRERTVSALAGVGVGAQHAMRPASVLAASVGGIHLHLG